MIKNNNGSKRKKIHFYHLLLLTTKRRISNDEKFPFIEVLFLFVKNIFSINIKNIFNTFHFFTDIMLINEKLNQPKWYLNNGVVTAVSYLLSICLTRPLMDEELYF